MRYILVSLLISLTSVSVFAKQDGDIAKELLCAVESATYHKRLLESQSLEVDKYKHCSISCIVGIECGVKPAAYIGIAKEVYDLFGGGKAELKDLLANLIGLRLSRRSDIQNFEECKSACKLFYPITSSK